MDNQNINSFSNESKIEGIQLISKTDFFCNNSVEGTLVAGYFVCNSPSQTLEAYIRYAAGDETEYTLQYQIDGGSKETFTFTPQSALFTKGGSFNKIIRE